MTGTILTFDRQKLYGWIAIADSQQRVFFHRRHIRLNQFGEQLSQAVVGAHVEFALISGRDGQPAAMDVHTYCPFPVDLSSHRELSTITYWDRNQQRGYAERGSGDMIGVHHRHIITSGLETVKVGTKIWHAITFRKGFDPATPLTKPMRDPSSVVYASQIEICIPERETVIA